MRDLKEEVKDLYFQKPDPGYIGLCLTGESGELVEAAGGEELLQLLLAARIAQGSGKIANWLKKMGRVGEFKEDKIKDIRSELPDIKFYIAVLENLIDADPDEDWHRKMNHNERKYKRPMKDRPNICQCDDCAKIEGADYVRD